MTGSKLRYLAWLLPVLVAGVFGVRIHTLRTETQEIAIPPPQLAPASPVAIPPTASNDEAQVVALLRQELVQLRARIASREQQARNPSPTSVPAPEAAATPRDISEAVLSFAEWRDAGTATPAALAETALWAGAGGDVQRMASLLIFDEAGLAAANALLDRLPADLRPAGADGRALIALLSTDAVPLTSAQLVGDFPQESGEHLLVLQLKPANDAPPGTRSRNVKLTARQDPASAEWRLVVPPSAVGSLARQLGAGPRAAGGAPLSPPLIDRSPQRWQ